MKYKYAAALVAVVVTTLSLAAFAQNQASGRKVYLLKSGGETIAELRVRASASVALESADASGHTEYNTSTGTMVAKGGATLRLTAGTNSISVRAEEIESVSDSK